MTGDRFTLEDGIFVPAHRPVHRDGEFDQIGFDVLLAMQRDHFWYRGRHRLLHKVLETSLQRHCAVAQRLRAIDLGGGCGGWIEYLHQRNSSARFDELALGDSSLRALSLAAPVVGDFATRHLIDLMDLGWSEEWDVVFLLDVIEHIPDHVRVLREVRKSLRPGGLLFITTPALSAFWSYNDVLAQHQRRYSKQDFRDLAAATGFQLLRSDYFMFLLSPALWISRLLSRPSADATPEELHATLLRTHSVPPRPINALLDGVLSLEAAAIDRFNFPWGTSILAVLRR